MTDRRITLPRDVNGIFKGATLPEDVARRCVSYQAPTPRPAGPQGATLPERKGDSSTPPPASSVVRLRPVRDAAIEALMGTVSCAKNHVCYRSGFVSLCRARAMLGGRLVECLERSLPCDHRLSLLHKRLCRCAIRQHLLHKLGR